MWDECHVHKQADEKRCDYDADEYVYEVLSSSMFERFLVILISVVAALFGFPKQIFVALINTR